MSEAEFVEWYAFASIEPLPQTRADLRAAMQMYILLTVNKRKGGKKIKLDSLIPDWWKDKSDPRRLAAKFRALTAHLDQPEEEGAEHEHIRGSDGKRA